MLPIFPLGKNPQVLLLLSGKHERIVGKPDSFISAKFEPLLCYTHMVSRWPSDLQDLNPIVSISSVDETSLYILPTFEHKIINSSCFSPGPVVAYWYWNSLASLIHNRSLQVIGFLVLIFHLIPSLFDQPFSVHWLPSLNKMQTVDCPVI